VVEDEDSIKVEEGGHLEGGDGGQEAARALYGVTLASPRSTSRLKLRRMSLMLHHARDVIKPS